MGVDQGTFKAAIDWFKSKASYSTMNDKPSINGVELDGNKTSEDLNIQPSVVISGLAMQVVGTNVHFYTAESSEDTLKATIVEDGNIRFVR